MARCRDYKPLADLSLPPADVDAVMAAMFDVPAAPGTKVELPKPTTPSVAVTPAAPPLVTTPPSGTPVTTQPAQPAMPPPSKPKTGFGVAAAGAAAGFLVGGPVGAVIGGGAGLLLGWAGKK